jgi:hypothetical protein
MSKYVYEPRFANPFIPDGGAKEWEGNELLLKDPILRKKSRVIPLDECVTDVYAFSDSMIQKVRPQLGGNATGAPFYLSHFGSDAVKPYEEEERSVANTTEKQQGPKPVSTASGLNSFLSFFNK